MTANEDIAPIANVSILKRLLKWVGGLVVVIVLLGAFFMFNPNYFYAGIVMVYKIINFDYKKLDQIKDYNWSDEKLKVEYSQQIWNPIKISKVQGLVPFVEKSVSKLQSVDEVRPQGFLRTEGGLNSYGYWLENASGTIIDSKEKLINAFTPLDTVEIAISFLVVQVSDVTATTSGVILGNTVETKDGYLIQLVNRNRFGCGDHIPTGVIYKVKRDGSFEKVASEKIVKKRDPFGLVGVSCVD